jgi:nitrogen-specific signal transduction histidine kinase
MDDTVEVDSEPGRTVFSFVLPGASYAPAAISREITSSTSA